LKNILKIGEETLLNICFLKTFVSFIKTWNWISQWSSFNKLQNEWKSQWKSVFSLFFLLLPNTTNGLKPVVSINFFVLIFNLRKDFNMQWFYRWKSFLEMMRKADENFFFRIWYWVRLCQVFWKSTSQKHSSCSSKISKKSDIIT